MLSAVPANARETVAHAAREGFLAGLNEILVVAAVLAFAGAILAAVLVREQEVERQPAEDSGRATEPVAA